MKPKFFLMILALFLIVNPILVKADSISNLDDEFKVIDSKIDGNRFSIDFKIDNDGNGADKEDKKVNCSWYEFWEWLDDDGECQIESYDIIYDKKEGKIISDWSMFKLQKKDKDWETPLITNYTIYEEEHLLSKVIEYEDGSILNVTYITYKKNIKWLLNITAGETAEYRLKFRLKAEDIKDYGSRQIGFGNLIYDWSDITKQATSYSIKDNIFEQYTILGNMTEGQNIEIDPTITTDTTVTNPAFSNLMKDSSGNYWYVAKNTSHRLIYSDILGAWALNSTNNTNFSSSDGFASAIDTNGIIHIADSTGDSSAGTYITFSTVTGAWSNSSNTWEGTDNRIVIDEDDDIYILADDSTPDVYMWKGNSSGWTNFSISVRTSQKVHVRGLANSENYLFVNYQAQGRDYIYHNYINKSTLAVSSEVASTSTQYINTSDAVTVDFDLDYMASCWIEKPSTYKLFCRNFNGTNVSGEQSWDIDDTVSIYFGRTDTAIYLFMINSTNSTRILEMNDTDLSDGQLYFDFDNQIDYLEDIDRDGALQITDTMDSSMGIAYKTTSSANTEFTEYPEGLLVDVYDEDTGVQLTNWSITVTDQYSNVYSATNVDTYYNDSISGNITIHIEKDGYAERYYYANNLGYYELDAYLLNYSDSQLTTFTVVDSVSSPIAEANITIERFIGGSWTMVAQRITGVTGLVSFYLDPDVSYRVTTSATGYTTYTFIDILTSDTYTITLYSAVSTWASVLTGIANTRLMPIYPTYKVNTELTNTYTVASPDGWLTEFGLSITSWNGTVLYSNTSSSSTGGQLTYTKNWTASDCNFTTGCNFTALANFTTNNSSTYQTEKIYYITNMTSGTYSLVSIYENITGLGANKSWYVMFFIIIISAFVGSWVAFRYGALTGAIVSEMIMGVAVALGMFDLTIYIISLLLLGAIAFIISNITGE